MIPTIAVFESSPDGGRGLARDMPVRWALEEVGQTYNVRLLSFKALKEPPHLALQPFGQIPTYEEGDLVLFESGAIVFHLANTRTGLLPDDGTYSARVVTWMFAAVNTVEPPIFDRDMARVLDRDKPWQRQRLDGLETNIRKRLDALATYLAKRDWLEETFSAGDIMMVSVLRRLLGSGILEEYSTLSTYVARAQARPAFERAFDAQRAVFESARQGHQH